MKAGPAVLSVETENWDSTVTIRQIENLGAMEEKEKMQSSKQVVVGKKTLM